MITDNKFKFWIDNKLNVLFIGKHGVGKTARVKEAFDQAGLNWVYFSASTLDPWVDFIGIPKEIEDENGMKYIDLIRPKAFAEDSVEAIFLDEFNRSPKKVRNAVMELLQFKSINGKRFKNLKIVWAAINPDEKESDDSSEDLEYDVEKLDPAQKDRFEIHMEVPYKPDKGYFNTKFGVKLSDRAIEWWNSLSKKEKDLVSPRRLDYTLDVHKQGGDVRDVLPKQCNVSKLLLILRHGPFAEMLESLYREKNNNKTVDFMSNKNNFDNSIDTILKNKNYLNYFIPFFRDEEIVKLMRNNTKVFNAVTKNTSTTRYDNLIQNILDARSPTEIYKKLKRDANILNRFATSLKKLTNSNKNKKCTFSNVLTFSNTNLGNKLAPFNKKRGLYSNIWRKMSNLSINSLVNHPYLLSELSKGTNYRTSIYNRLYKEVQSMTTIIIDPDFYLHLLNILCTIISSSHDTKYFYKIEEFFGYVAYNYISSYNIPYSDLFKQVIVYNGSYNKIIRFLNHNAKLYA